MRTLVLLSGGMDSTALLALLEPEAEHALSFDYGQRHRKELDAAAAVAGHYQIPHTVLDLKPVLAGLPSALTDPDIAVPEGHYSDETMAATVVPGRNLVFASAAVAFAAGRGLDRVALAVHAGDHPVYPDCRPEFISTLSLAAKAAYGVEVVAPFVHKSKAEIAGIGDDHVAPFALSWSCYAGEEIHCGRCGTCVERAEAFGLAKMIDPTVYIDPDFWREQVAA